MNILQLYAPRYQEVVTEFHALQDNIPPAFKQKFARYELEKKGFPTEQINDDDNLFEEVPGEENPVDQTEIDHEKNKPENRLLTLAGLLFEIGKSEDYINKRAAYAINVLRTAGYDFTCPVWVEEFKLGKRGRGASETTVKFTPAGYLATFSYMSPTFCGKELKKKYTRFQSMCSAFTAKLDLIYTEMTRALINRNGELSLQNRRARLALTNTTNRTNLSFWAHLTNLCKTQGKVAPVFSPWNRNAQRLQDLRVELSADGRVYKPNSTAWLYRDAAAKNFVINQFQHMGLQ
jgi:hypothetical protein